MKQLGFSLEEIKKMSVLQINLYIQRHAEPLYKSEVDQKIFDAERKHGRR
jgi:hypothetical protein